MIAPLLDVMFARCNNGARQAVRFENRPTKENPMSSIKACLAAVSIATLALSQSPAIAGTCGPNTWLPDEAIPYNPIFEQGCSVHDSCLGNSAPCGTTGGCAAVRDGLFLASCDNNYGWWNPGRYLCYGAASMFSRASDAFTCATGYGCVPWNQVGACNGDDEMPLMYE